MRAQMNQKSRPNINKSQEIVDREKKESTMSKILQRYKSRPEDVI